MIIGFERKNPDNFQVELETEKLRNAILLYQ